MSQINWGETYIFRKGTYEFASLFLPEVILTQGLSICQDYYVFFVSWNFSHIVFWRLHFIEQNSSLVNLAFRSDILVFFVQAVQQCVEHALLCVSRPFSDSLGDVLIRTELGTLQT